MYISRSFIIIICSFIIPIIASADVVITEIMYDAPGADTGYEWVEIQNVSSSAIDVGSWYFFENNVHHGLYPEGFTLLEPNAYAMIVQNLETGVLAVGSGVPLIKSSFSLHNTSETLAMSDPEKNIVFSFTYHSDMGANGNGKTLQYYNGTWIEADPTPGRANSNVSTQDPEQESSEDEELSETQIQLRDFYTGFINIKGDTLARSTLHISAHVTHTKGRRVDFRDRGAYFINFGDGTSIESGNHIDVEHVYEYPGNYTITLEYYTSFLAYEAGVEPDAFLQRNINIQEPEFSIIDIDARSGIVFKNDTSSDINLDGWNITDHKGRVYVFPKNSYIQRGATLVVPYTAHGFSGIADVPWISLRNENNITLFSFNPKTKTSSVSSTSSSSSQVPSTDTSEGISSLDAYLLQNPDKIRVDFGNAEYLPPQALGVSTRISYEILVGLGLLALVFVLLKVFSRSKEQDESKPEEAKVMGDIELLE